MAIILYLVFASALFLAALSLLLPVKSSKRKPNLPPGLWKLPVIGNIHQLGTAPHISLRRLAAKLGPIIHLQLGQLPVVVVSSARTAKEIMKTHDPALASRPQLFSARHLFYNCSDIAFAPYGEYWRRVRKICILELLSAKRVQSFAPVRQEEAARLVQRVASTRSESGPLDLSNLLGHYANDVLCRVAFGRDFSAGGEYDRHGFQKMLEEFMVLLGGFELGDFFPSMEFVHTLTGHKRRLQQTFRRFDQFFDEVIEEHLGRRGSVKEEKKDLVDVLLEIQGRETDETPLTMDNIKALMSDMFAAGTDTTFITLDWGMTELVTHPRVLQKAQAELKSVVGERKFVSEEIDLPQLHYLKAIIKEIYRLHPPAPVLLPRESMEAVTIDGYEIPKGTRFFVNAWAIGRDPESWPQDPEEFWPERFVGSPVDFRGQDFELTPFGSGRRSCPGINLGEATVELALAQLLHSFDWELPRGVQAEDLDMTEMFGITMHRSAHLMLVAKPRFV